MVTFKQLVDTLIANPSVCVDTYNNVTDSSMVQPTTTDEMTKILTWSYVAMHRLNKLPWLDDDGEQIDVITTEVLEDFTDIINHNIVLLVNNWRQTQFFQKDSNGKDIVEGKNEPVALDGVYGESVDAPTTTATVAYNLFDINLRADQNLAQVCQILKDIYLEYRQYLGGFVCR